MDKKHLTLGSLFDGSGGFPLGGILAAAKLNLFRCLSRTSGCRRCSTTVMYLR